MAARSVGLTVCCESTVGELNTSTLTAFEAAGYSPADPIDDQLLAAIDYINSYPGESTLGLGEKLREAFPPEICAQALSVAELRTKAKSKFGSGAANLFATRDGLEQASRVSVADWRASIVKNAGIELVIDLGCGIGADSMALIRAGISVIGIELDQTTASYAAKNFKLAAAGHSLPIAETFIGDATKNVSQLADLGQKLVGEKSKVAFFIDPARRVSGRRTWRVQDLQPSWDFVSAMLDSGVNTVVKLGPGFEKSLIPANASATWVSADNQLVETTVYSAGLLERALEKGVVCGFDNTKLASCQPVSPAIRAAVVLPKNIWFANQLSPNSAAKTTGAVDNGQLVGKYLYELDGCVTRAGLSEVVAAEIGGFQLGESAAYLCSQYLVDTSFASVFSILGEFDYSIKRLKSWARQHEIGVLEIKKRGVDIDPALLRKQLKLSGKNTASVVITRIDSKVKFLPVSRIVPAKLNH